MYVFVCVRARVCARVCACVRMGVSSRMGKTVGGLMGRERARHRRQNISGVFFGNIGTPFTLNPNR